MSVYSCHIPKRYTELVNKGFAYNSKRRFRWLQKACLWILSKLKCELAQEIVTHKITKVNFDSLYNLIAEQARAIEAQTGQFPRCVIMGQEQAYQLFEETIEQQVSFNMGGMNGVPPTVFGMAIIVAPWFDGVVCLTEL